MTRLLFVALAVAVAGCPTPGSGYVRSRVDSEPNGKCLAWSDRNYVYHLDPALSARTPGDTERAAVTAAFAAWQQVADGCSDFRFTEGAGGTGSNRIVWREQLCSTAAPASDPCFSDGTCPDKYACWDSDSMTLALTTTTYSRSMATLLDAEIQLNGAGWLFTTVDSPACMQSSPAVDCVATDVQNTMTHELGHAVGFEHVAVLGSTMLASAPIGETSKRNIDDGTRQGFCAVYPKAKPSPACE